MLDNVGDVEDGAIVGRQLGIVGEEEVAACPAARFQVR